MRRLLLVLLALAACVTLATGARADGDPASDVLVYRNVYVPYATPSRSAASSLADEVAAAYAKGFRVKVAVIQSKADLGAIPSLWGKPAQYAHFLGSELSTLYIGPLLIVMPSGYGIYDGGRTTQAEEKVLATLGAPRSRRSTDLVGSASNAVSRLLAAGALRSKDVLMPYSGIIGTGVSGRRVTVRYFLSDDSGSVSATLTLFRGAVALATVPIPSHTTNLAKSERRTIELPAGAAAAGAKVCIVAVDPAGNRSARSCKKL